MLYFFHTRNSDGLVLDEEGSEFGDVEAAQLEAERFAREFAREDLLNGAIVERQIELTNGAGQLIGKVSVRDVAAGYSIKTAITSDEFDSLHEVGRGIDHGPILSAHALRLLELRYIYRLLGGLKITTAGRDRLRRGR
jgi:hypothetical protein